MIGKRTSAIAACGFVLAGACTSAGGAWRAAPFRVSAQVVAACRMNVPAHVPQDAVSRAVIAVRCTHEVPYSIRLMLPHDSRRGAKASARPVVLALVSF